jgi:tetratricopeptide (TPR) repeat protein
VKDSFDQVVTCHSTAALEAYDQAVDCQLHAWTGALAAVEQALEQAPDFALAHSTRALLLQSAGRGAEAREASTQALLFAKAVTEREQSHIAIINLMLEGRSAAALQNVRSHAEQWPLDALVMSLALGAFGMITFSGRADHDQQRFDFVQKLIPHYPANHPWFLSHRGWVLIETNQPEVGLPFVLRSLELRPENGNAAHVMMHARFELNEPELAMRFANAWLAQYPDTAMLYGHVHWHTALCELELGQTEQAINRLLTVIEPHLAYAPPLVGMTDTASLLWRLKLRGLNNLNWAIAEKFAQDKFANGGNVFAELHLAMLAAGTGQPAALNACRLRLQKHADAGHGGALSALAWVDGLASWLARDISTARQALTECVKHSVTLGGSHAQRTVIERTLASVS